MAELFHILYDVQHAGSGTIPPPPGLGASTKGTGNGGDGFTEYSKEEVEKFTQTPVEETPKRFGTEAIKIHGPIIQAKVLTGEFETAAVGCKFVKYILGGEVQGVLSPSAGKSELKEATPTNKEAGEKPMSTVKKSELTITAAV